MNHQHVLVVVDPSSNHGEAAIDHAIEAGHDDLVVLVSLTGRAAIALEEYAASEEISVAEAADVYLEQVVERLAARGVTVTAMATVALDTAIDLAACVIDAGAALVVIPALTGVLDGDEIERVARMTGVPVVLVPVPVPV